MDHGPSTIDYRPWTMDYLLRTIKQAMNLFITGITGFVGTSLVNYFKTKSNVNVYGHSRDTARAVSKFNDSSVSIQPEFSSALSDSLNIDCVIHLAGLAHDLSNQYTPA